MAGGRPREYDPKLCDELIDHMSKGYSFETFGALVHHSKDTLYRWLKEYPEFSDAYEIARIKCQMFWERGGISGTFGLRTKTVIDGKEVVVDPKKFNASSWSFNMKNRFRWTDRQDLTTGDEKLPAPLIYKPEKKPEGEE